MQLHLVIQEREVEISSKAPCIHLVETAPSILRKMPWVVLKNHPVRELTFGGGEWRNGISARRVLLILSWGGCVCVCVCVCVCRGGGGGSCLRGSGTLGACPQVKFGGLGPPRMILMTSESLELHFFLQIIQVGGEASPPKPL